MLLAFDSWSTLFLYMYVCLDTLHIGYIRDVSYTSLF